MQLKNENLKLVHFHCSLLIDFTRKEENVFFFSRHNVCLGWRVNTCTSQECSKLKCNGEKCCSNVLFIGLPVYEVVVNGDDDGRNRKILTIYKYKLMSLNHWLENRSHWNKEWRKKKSEKKRWQRMNALSK